MKRLPIDDVWPDLRDALRAGPNAVLVAPPGSGKTTRVPLMMLDEPWLGGRRVLLLEPRRLAARSAAAFMARSLGEQTGETVGYRVRLDTRVGPGTRIEVVTEGVLTRMLQEDPALEGVGAVLFDEFHERSLHADLGLALCLEAQSLLRSDLRLVVMSATLEAEPVARLLGDAPVIASDGRAFPVETIYLGRSAERTAEFGPHFRAGRAGALERDVAAAVMRALTEREGDILVFLPGAGEIRRTEALLSAERLPSSVEVMPLYGSLPAERQDAAIAPAAAGRRKIVLSTSIAESSLTVEGVRVVIDAGLMRVPRFSPRTGMSRLETVPVSQASADQRKGRAGRVAPGTVYRLWSERDHALLPEARTPELLEADLAQLALELAVWGVSDPERLQWLDPPPRGAFAQARELLRRLGALDADGRATAHGRRMAELGTHPRLAHCILRAHSLGWADAACELAALLGDRDLLRGERNADMRLRVDALRRAARTGSPPQGADPAAVRRLLAEARELRRAADRIVRAEGAASGGSAAAAGPGAPAAGAAAHGADAVPVGLLLAFAFPDRIAQRRPDGRYLLANGRGAVLPGAQPLSRAEYIVAAELDDSGTESRILLAAEVSAADLERYCAESIAAEESVEWDSEARAVRPLRRIRLGAIVLKEGRLAHPDPESVRKALIRGLQEAGLEALPWTKTARQLLARMRMMSRFGGDWPDVSEEALLSRLDEWLGPYIEGATKLQDVLKVALADALEGMLTWRQRQELDREAPTHITVPSGSRIPIDYSDPESPVLAVRLQELFGLKETPKLANGRLPLTLHLLSPAHRPVQVTRDLSSFWSEAYFEVRKELRSRYPKHVWPDDPLSAAPTNRAKPRGNH
ncbi:ATP-dependent helicase HrpB [Paenibacillus cisolokensis]|uniref:ATP-dependent helicase HrpB n=1 Tax=Paenibacillus cisolokensis TaxID=1658519 RepID=A0ABQ4N2R4_9BACL|nr:ATP-dependent helicase HrpB [Paenibacillus cisolokensis]GIQ62481.1 ATP-dependent helicase HrpB [Paenibacillus cisolokensis]